MIKSILITGLVCLGLTGFTGQDVDKMPSPQGGMEALIKHFQSEIKYPKQARKEGVEGRVYVVGVVTKEGKIEQVEVAKGIGAGCDAEAVRAVKAFQNWIPGEKDGKKVDVQITIPVEFALDGKKKDSNG